jgi:hypothetical protein
MGEVTLKISTDVREALKGTEQLDKNIDELNKDTQAYNQRATAGFNQTGQAATNASQGVSKATQAFKVMGGAIAGAFSVAAIVQWGKVIVNSTGAGGDAVERFRQAAQRAFQALNTAIATADFSNLVGGIRQAWIEGKRYADVLDEIQARQVALGAYKATLETLQAEQKLIARNAQNSIEVRQAAIEKIIELERQKLSETLLLQNKELDEALRAAAVRTGIDTQDEASLERRKQLVLEWAQAYGTATGTEALNEQLAAAEKLQAELESLITTQQVYSGDVVTTVKNYDEYNKALKELNPQQRELLDLKRLEKVITDEERDSINKIIGSRAQSNTQAIEQETALQRLRNQLRTELLGEEEKKAKADKERTKSTVEENLASLDKYVEEANKKIFDIELGFGGEQSAEQYQKQIEDNLKAFNEAMESNPMFSDENGAQAKAYDDAQKLMQDNLSEFERIQQETWDNMQAFSEAHPLASALGFESEEQLQQIQEYGEQIMSFVNDMIDQQIEARTRLVDDWNQKIEEQEALVEREQEDKQEGLANNYESEKENLVKMQQIRDQAIKDREKYVKLQQAINTAESASSLIVASANILEGFSEIPLVGQILGLAAIATMLAGFIAAQTKIKDAVQMEEGGQAKHGLLRGRRHSQGGIPIEAEDGEWFINRNSSLKYSPLLNAINKDDREGMRLFFDRQFINRMPQQRFDIDSSKKLGEIVRELKKGKADITYGPGYIIERIGGYTKKINLN